MDKLNILWTTDNKVTILNMFAMYASNSKQNGWWKEINVIVWGASTKLLCEDKQVQFEVKEMIKKGITFEACKSCADTFEASAIFDKLGIDVRYTGLALTKYLKSGETVLTI